MRLLIRNDSKMPVFIIDMIYNHDIIHNFNDSSYLINPS